LHPPRGAAPDADFSFELKSINGRRYYTLDTFSAKPSSYQTGIPADGTHLHVVGATSIRKRRWIDREKRTLAGWFARRSNQEPHISEQVTKPTNQTRVRAAVSNHLNQAIHRPCN
jgi:hypothetical protein